MVPTKQGGHQAAGLCVAICFGIGGGIIVGKEAHQTLRHSGTKTKSQHFAQKTVKPVCFCVVC